MAKAAPMPPAPKKPMKKDMPPAPAPVKSGKASPKKK